MYMKQVILLCFLSFFVRESLFISTRIYFSKCGVGGFSCLLTNGKYKITYQCPKGTTDVLFYLWQFRALSNTESVAIKNCTNFRLSFTCTSETKPITHLHIANITNLFIIKTTRTHNPQNIIFENIENLEYLPPHTFSQIKRDLVSGCINPVKDLENLYFNKVKIGIIAPNAFNELKEFYNFSWNEVEVKNLQHSAVQLEFNQAGNFSIQKSNFEVCEHWAFKIIAPKVLFVENKFVDIYSGAINATVESFKFNSNNVNNLQSYGFSILAEFVTITNNRFEYCHAAAFEKITPILFKNHQRNFANLKFLYDFSKNYINFMDAGSLNPDIPAYENVATDLRFNRNTLLCSCENLGWLLSELGHGHNSVHLQDFYETIMSEEYENMCAYTSCELPLGKAKELIVNGKCLGNITAENLCKVKKEPKIETTTKQPQIVMAHSSTKNYNPFIILVVLLLAKKL